MGNDSKIAYTQYIKQMIEKVRDLKRKGHDVSECNKLLQSLVAAVLNSDKNCSDFLINELEAAVEYIESLEPPYDFNSKKPGTFPTVSDDYFTPTGKKPEEKFRYVYKETPHREKREEKSKLIVMLIYSFLILFMGITVTLIVYIIRWS